MPTLECVVRLPDCEHVRFTIKTHLIKSGDERLIEPEFYVKMPEGAHYELEIVAPSLWDKERYKGPMHYHTSTKSGRQFVCFPFPLPTLEKAVQILKAWCLGTAYTVHTGQDFNPVYDSQPATFVERMANSGIAVESFEEIAEAK